MSGERDMVDGEPHRVQERNCLPDPKGNYDWNSVPKGRYYVEWYRGGTRRRASAGVTTLRHLMLSVASTRIRNLGVPGSVIPVVMVSSGRPIVVNDDCADPGENVVIPVAAK